MIGYYVNTRQKIPWEVLLKIKRSGRGLTQRVSMEDGIPFRASGNGLLIKVINYFTASSLSILVYFFLGFLFFVLFCLLCRQCCSYLTRVELMSNFQLQSLLSFHFSVQFLRLVISITDKWKVTIVSQYLKFFVVLLQSLMSSLCRVVFRFHDYITFTFT